MSDKTKRIIKERLSVLAVILSCMALVVVVQEVQRLLAEAARPSPTAPGAAAATPTLRPIPKPTATSPQGTAGVGQSPASTEGSPPPSEAEGASSPGTGGVEVAPQKPVNFSGKWVGTFSETLEGETLQYQYTLELVQQGTILSGKSTVAKADDPNINARFIIRGKLVSQSNPPAIQLTEDLFAAQGLHTGSAGAPRTTQLGYSSAEGLDALEGEWVDRRNPAAQVTGVVKLVRQP
jgi:hypothetical protein